ncbi:MAG TPA: aminotransferase class V-fold PLP-dependent enzyme [Solirubrobacteraceae bacterium]|nr:aminotransferase class V-fold PLP-dependent enzyme [Solirubrobacteraceae bacterium]
MSGLTRKQLLAGAAAAGVVAGCGGSSSKPAAYDPGDWASVKAQFRLSGDVRAFDAFVFATHPKPVRDAIERHRRGLDADPAGYLHENEIALDQRVLDAAARYLDVPPDSFAFTDSTTMGLGLVYGGIEIDGEPVATEHDFYSTHESLRLRFGKFRQIRLYDDPARATVAAMVEAARSIDAGMLALTWVHSGTGVKIPVQAIAEAVRPALVVLDGVHGLAADDLRIDSVDVLVAGTHKWLGGPRGTGLVWSRAWDRLRPIIPPFHPGSPAASWNPGGYHTFEHRWALAEAFDFHHRLGRARVAERIRSLATRLKEGLADLPDVRLVTPMSPSVSGGIVCFEVDGLDPPTAVDRLRREHKVAASVTPYAQPYVRLGTGLWVDEADVDAALDAISRL